MGGVFLSLLHGHNQHLLCVLPLWKGGGVSLPQSSPSRLILPPALISPSGPAEAQPPFSEGSRAWKLPLAKIRPLPLSPPTPCLQPPWGQGPGACSPVPASAAKGKLRGRRAPSPWRPSPAAAQITWAGQPPPCREPPPRACGGGRLRPGSPLGSRSRWAPGPASAGAPRSC